MGPVRKSLRRSAPPVACKPGTGETGRRASGECRCRKSVTGTGSGRCNTVVLLFRTDLSRLFGYRLREMASCSMESAVVMILALAEYPRCVVMRRTISVDMSTLDCSSVLEAMVP